MTTPRAAADPGPSHRPGRAVTRQAILTSARQAWTEHGFDEVGLREIAGRAGVTAALVNRYFGTKEDLFREAIDSEDTGPPGLTDLDRASFGTQMAPMIVAGHRGAGDSPRETTADHSAFDAILMLLHSASSPAAQPIIRDHVETTVLPSLIEYFGNDDTARKRAVLVLSLALGSTLLGPILGVEPLATASGPAGPESDPETTAIAAAMLQSAADADPGDLSGAS
jgi:AcrR family transcriptional regulator